MSANNLRPGSSSKPNPVGFTGLAPNSVLLDKLNLGRSTPDSEALASSDDEGDAHRQEQAHHPVQPQKPVRRTSWLNDTTQPPIAQPRKGSFASSTMSPTASHPSTPSGEAGVAAWGSHSAHGGMGRPHQNPPSFPWGTGIWNAERSKEPPARLSEVLPSPTSNIAPGIGGSSFFANEHSFRQTSPGPRETGSNSQIPFAIPLHPTPKTYRSQSYSVGQLEPDANGSATGGATVLSSRGRHIGPSGLQHRPSRPSMLSEMSNEGAMLGKLNEENDDDDESTQSSGHGSHLHQSAEAKTIELLARENAMLRQQQQQQQYQNSRIRPRAASSYGIGNGYSVRDAVPEESDYAVDELDESNDGHIKRGISRRMSEYGAGISYSGRSPYPVENRKLENVKKAYWQSSPFSGGLGGDITGSRRHSFADISTRQGSISSVPEAMPIHEAVSPEAAQSQDYAGFAEGAGFGPTSPMSYFTVGGGPPGTSQGIASAAYGGLYPSPYGGLPGHTNRPPSPHRNMFGMSQPRHNQLLYIVLFKCSRADVFFIQEGTGLTVKPGDLVIVEADRGTDLGTVDRSEVDWQTAKELKEHYAEEHYKWLMMYSHNAAAAQEGTGAGMMAASNGMQGGAIGGMGPPSHHHQLEANAGELKPKLIKRLAQSHEIQNLREKEGNEAKAKRVCMQKVKEHGLNMEILDAEFQM
jgi:hypothetical protein